MIRATLQQVFPSSAPAIQYQAHYRLEKSLRYRAERGHFAYTRNLYLSRVDMPVALHMGEETIILAADDNGTVADWRHDIYLTRGRVSASEALAEIGVQLA